MYDSISQAEGDRLGAGNARAPTGHVLRRDAEQTTRLPGKHILAVAQERVGAAIKRHVVRVAGGHTNTGTGELAAVPTALLTHTAASNISVCFGGNMNIKVTECDEVLGKYHVLQSFLIVSLL